MGRTRVRRRRRIAAVMATIAVAVVLSAPVAGALGRHPETSDKVAPARRGEQVYVVRTGDSVWSIAERTAEGGDPRALVDAIAARNGIDAGAVVPGQALVIPSVA